MDPILLSLHPIYLQNTPTRSTINLNMIPPHQTDNHPQPPHPHLPRSSIYPTLLYPI
jgi:hypothetical protein